MTTASGVMFMEICPSPGFVPSSAKTNPASCNILFRFSNVSADGRNFAKFFTPGYIGRTFCKSRQFSGLLTVPWMTIKSSLMEMSSSGTVSRSVRKRFRMLLMLLLTEMRYSRVSPPPMTKRLQSPKAVPVTLSCFLFNSSTVTLPCGVRR